MAGDIIFKGDPIGCVERASWEQLRGVDEVIHLSINFLVLWSIACAS